MHGRERFVFLRFEYSELRCRNSLKFGSLYMPFGSYLKMPSKMRTKPCNKDVIGLNA